MKWKEFKGVANQYFSNRVLLWFHREIELGGANVVALFDKVEPKPESNPTFVTIMAAYRELC